jgi:hypothetical protein
MVTAWEVPATLRLSTEEKSSKNYAKKKVRKMQDQTQKLVKPKIFGNIHINMVTGSAIYMLTIPKMKLWRKKLSLH